MKTAQLLFFLFLTVALTTCKNESAADGDNTSADANEETQGTAAPALAPGQSAEANFLMKDFWVFEFYVKPHDRETSQFNRGRWYVFKPDGTFESGHWEEQTAKGTWRLRKDESMRTILTLDSEIDAEDSEYTLQFNADGDAASWVGTKAYPEKSNVMLKAINLGSRPTKKQFGIE